MQVQERVLQVNDAYLPFLEDDTRLQIFFGGSSSGKSFFLAQRVVMDVLGGRNYLVCRAVARTLKGSVYNQVVKTIDAMGLRGQFVITKSEMTITCRRNGRQILFAGLDDVEKLKSITPARGVLTDIWIEEATETDKGAYKQLSKRLRGLVEGDLAKRITLSFNPITKQHWIYDEFFGRWQGESAQGAERGRPGADESKAFHRGDGLQILKTTYKDNAFLTADDIAELENESDPYYHDVYTLGNWGVLGNLIYKNHRTEDLSGLIPGFDNIRNGLDFGFADDPDALVRCHVDEKRRKLYVFGELYQCGMHDDELAEELRQRIGDGYVTCDSADPKAISDLCRRGVRALSAVKGPDSVRFGIRYLQGFEIIIDLSCQHFINEIETYQWAEDKYGNVLQRPVDKNNHLLDALRYAVEDMMLQNRAEAAERI